MGINWDVKADANRAMEHPKSRPFTWIILGSVIVIVSITYLFLWIWGSAGKDVETPFMKVHTPEKTVIKKDTTIINNDNHKEINIDKNYAPINVN